MSVSSNYVPVGKKGLPLLEVKTAIGSPLNLEVLHDIVRAS